MEHLTEIILAIFASTGFWACVQAVILKHMDRRSAERAALLGLLHERLVDISEGQYRDLDEYIYQPYRNLGGNGTGEEYMKRVQALIFERKEKK